MLATSMDTMPSSTFTGYTWVDRTNEEAKSVSPPWSRTAETMSIRVGARQDERDALPPARPPAASGSPLPRQRASIGLHVSLGVRLRSTKLSGYHSRISPVLMSNVLLVDGQMMQPSCGGGGRGREGRE